MLSLVLLLPACKSKDVKPTVVLITIDTLRRDFLGCYGYQADTSPFIDQLAEEGLVYKNTVTPLPLTDGSHASILTGLHPVTHEVLFNATRMKKDLETLPEVMKKNGYYTIGTVSVYHMSGYYGFGQGFDTYSDKWKHHAHIKMSNPNWFRVGQSVNESLFEQIDDYTKNHKDKPLFIWVHYYDPHVPYVKWEHIDLDFSKVNSAKRYVNYSTEIRYTDNHIRKLFNYLKEKGLTDDMLTCVTADHGEQLGEHGYSACHFDIYSETTFVPLIFHGYGVPKGKVIDDYVTTMDIAPTLLGLLNLSFQKPVHGMNLLDEDHDPKPLPERDIFIVGDPTRVRAMELIRQPYAYIRNFDNQYKSFYISTGSEFPEDKLEKVTDNRIRLKHFEKSGKDQIRVRIPSKFRTGRNYLVFRFDVIKGDQFSVGYYYMRQRMLGAGTGINDSNPKTVTAYFPITPLDEPLCFVNRKGDTEVGNFRFAYLEEKEFQKYISEVDEKKNGIFKTLSSPRKKIEHDELFNLDTDIGMNKNLLPDEQLTNKINAYKVRMMELYKFFVKDTKRVTGKTKSGEERELSEEEKKMLKSLGYL